MKTAYLEAPVEPALLAGFWAFSARSNLSPSVALRRVVGQALTKAGYEVDDYDAATERTNDYEQWARRRKAVDERGTRPFVKARVSPGMRAAFEQFANACNASAPALLQRLVQHVVQSARIDVTELDLPKPPPLRSERVTVRFSLEEMEAIRPLAAEFGSVREWLVALARSRIQPGSPQFSQREVHALYESNRELWAIGRNINQIAHALNLDLKQAGRLHGSRAHVDELSAVKALIDAHTHKVMALCNASLDRWSSV